MHMTCARFEIAGDETQQRGLAGAVGADDTGPTAGELDAHLTENWNGIGV